MQWAFDIFVVLYSEEYIGPPGSGAPFEPKFAGSTRYISIRCFCGRRGRRRVRREELMCLMC